MKIALAEAPEIEIYHAKRSSVMAADNDMIGPHEGREFTLMLSGSKPLSVFYSEDSVDEFCNFTESAFDEQVSLGRFVKRTTQRLVVSPQGTPIKIRTILFSQADQTWRIDAYLFITELYESFGPGYRPDLERMIGNLLGYTSDEIEAFISHVRANGAYMAYS